MTSTHSHKYTFSFKDKRIVFNKLAHESEFHPFAKALIYALYHKQYPTMRVEAKIDDRFQPDLNALGLDGAMLFWAEVGNVSINKIEKLFKKYRQAHFVFIKEAADVPTFEMHLEKRFKKAPRLPLIDIVVYPEHFHDWYVSEEGDVFIPLEEVTVIRWHGPENSA